MWFELYLRGILIGLTASIPLGPVGVLCIQRTLSKNHKSGFLSGLGAATADTFYATVAFFSLTIVLGFIESHMALLKGIGGLCIMIVGAHIFFSNPIVQIRRNRAGRSNLWQDYLSVFLLTIANPAFILVFVALFAAFGLSVDVVGNLNGSTMIVGVFTGCSAWWFLLTFVVNLFRKKIRPRHLLWMNRISGTLIAILGAVAILSMVVNFQPNAVFP